MVSVLIVEDQLDYQIYLNTVINSCAEFKNLGIVRLGIDAIKQISALQPNIVLMDIGLPDISGLECLRRSKASSPNVKFLICTVHEEDENIFNALKEGANGYIEKRAKHIK